MSSRSVATLAMLTALVAALGYLLAGVPNVELMTLGAFVSGALQGAGRGAVVGSAAMAVYSGFNPYGMAPPPTFLMQVLGCGGIGAAGGWLAGGHRAASLSPWQAAWAGGVVGLALSFFYDVLTNLGTAWSTGLAVVPVLVGGISFGVWHIAWNTVAFAVAGPPLLAAVRRRGAASL